MKLICLLKSPFSALLILEISEGIGSQLISKYNDEHWQRLNIYYEAIAKECGFNCAYIFLFIKMNNQ